MEDESFINIKRFFFGLSCLVFVLAMAFLVFTFGIRDVKETILPPVESPITYKIKKKIPWLVKKSGRLFHPIIIEAAGEYQVEPALIKAIIMAESGYNPLAVSKRGAVGLMQLMPETAEALGVEDVFDPEHNINGGVKYFRQLLAKFKGDVKLALAAYNAGTTNVMKYQGIPPYKATQYFIKKVFKFYQYYTDMAEKINNA